MLFDQSHVTKQHISSVKIKTIPVWTVSKWGFLGIWGRGVCVCICAWEREREGGRKGWKGKEGEAPDFQTNDLWSGSIHLELPVKVTQNALWHSSCVIQKMLSQLVSVYWCCFCYDFSLLFWHRLHWFHHLHKTWAHIQREREREYCHTHVNTHILTHTHTCACAQTHTHTVTKYYYTQTWLKSKFMCGFLKQLSTSKMLFVQKIRLEKAWK